MKDYAEYIKAVRKNAGLTQKELAESIGVATGTIQQYELGKRQPRFEVMDKIRAACGREAELFYFHEKGGGRIAYNGKWVPETNDSTEMMDYFDMLNKDGQKEAIKRVQELTEIPRYQKQQPSEED